ncbi:hypothetical protein QP866_04405 [Corynebacterium imitans]|uniref:hypothetical protein n=1 Tax=Corynebacterium imitans TaxID=156978 RepID=UPI00254CA7B5|nr:hypothetical protein [Corynebacterium imitans]MDK8306055.1 hypothetical protein [Corynebacterium imitans]MDK8637071.1 hypothetical protein [Corynebacterium imitans]MDK8772256.1 hypothetical protein [Corynebacterium imitans]
MKKTIALCTSALFASATLVGCGSSSEWDGAWSGDVTPTESGQPHGAATLTIDGGDCSWELTEPTGETNDARCEQDDEEFKLADPLSGRDLEYKGQINGDTLTMTPDNDRAERIGVMVLTRTTDEEN